MRWPKTIRCEVQGCTRSREVRGMCRLHYSEDYRRWRRECQSNGSFTEASLGVLPEPPRWEFENDDGERELMEKVEREEKGAGI